MTVFTHPEFRNHEQIVFVSGESTGLKAIIAVHNTNLGPALGGCRMWNYAHEDEALTDVLRLSVGMTYKAAVADLPLGGGKSVIIGDSDRDKTPELMQAMGRAVERLGGRYIVAEDVGMKVTDMVEMARNTKHVVGLPTESGQAGGDPSPKTAYGVFLGLKAAVKHRLGAEDLGGLTVAVQGLGNVGYNLCRHLSGAGAKIVVTDVKEDKIAQARKEFGAEAVALADIYDVAADVFSPCALGAVINDDTLARLTCKVVAGAANNQLAEARHGAILKDRNILYTPDYVLNAGGLINVAYESPDIVPDGTEEKVLKHIERIPGILEDIFQRAEKEDIATSVAADRVAEGKFMQADPAASRKKGDSVIYA